VKTLNCFQTIWVTQNTRVMACLIVKQFKSWVLINKHGGEEQCWLSRGNDLPTDIALGFPTKQQCHSSQRLELIGAAEAARCGRGEIQKDR